MQELFPLTLSSFVLFLFLNFSLLRFASNGVRSVPRFYQEPPGRVRQEAENYRSPTELSLRRENSGGFSEGLYCPSLLSPSPSSERRNKIYATSLQLDRLPLKYLPSSHKFEHNRSTVRPAPKAQYFVHKKLTILSG